MPRPTEQFLFALFALALLIGVYAFVFVWVESAR